MKICVILNENAGSADRSAALLEAAEARDDVVVWTSEEKGDAVELSAQAAADGFDVVAAAGGDGTVNEVVNGLMGSDTRPALAVLPLGTGNDFARTAAIPANDAGEAFALLTGGERRLMDVFLMRTPDRKYYGINAAAGGFSGRVDEALTPEMKANWGPMAYLIGAATALPDLHDYDTYVKIDEGAPRQISALNVVVSNGRTIGGGKRVAPHASPEDGLLDIVVISNGTVVELADVATRLVAGNLAASPLVERIHARRAEIESTPGMWFNLDGELMTKQPIVLEVVPAALKVVVGPDYRAVVDE